MNNKKYVLVKGVAGMGNRTQAALTGLLYARLAGRRLLVDWSDSTYSDDGTNAFHRFFQCPIADPADRIPETDSVYPEMWRGHLLEDAGVMRNRYGDRDARESWRRFSFDLTRLDYPEDVLVMWAHTHKTDLLRGHFVGAFQPLSRASNEDILAGLMRDDLKLQADIRDRVDSFKAHFISGPTLGVHVRFSDHRAHLPSILIKVDELLSTRPDLRVFLCTDNIEIKKMFEKSYPGVVSAPHWYPEPGLSSHKNRYCPSQLENGIEALVDLYLLAECDYLVIDTSSSFSDLAALLTTAPKSNVFDVVRKGKRTPKLRRFIWLAWLRLGVFTWGLRAFRGWIRVARAVRSART